MTLASVTESIRYNVFISTDLWFSRVHMHPRKSGSRWLSNRTACRIEQLNNWAPLNAERHGSGSWVGGGRVSRAKGNGYSWCSTVRFTVCYTTLRCFTSILLPNLSVRFDNRRKMWKLSGKKTEEYWKDGEINVVKFENKNWRMKVVGCRLDGNRDLDNGVSVSVSRHSITLMKMSVV